MPTPDALLAFLVAAVLVTAAPGPDNLMVLGIGMARGRRHGVAFGLGCAAGCLSHTLLAALGVGALIAASPVAFTGLKVAGGLYLVWLGIQAWRSPGGARVSDPGEAARRSPGRLFAQGVMANAINPKVVVFFLSFLPQFVVADRGHAALQTVALGVVFTLQAALLFGLLGWFSGTVGGPLQRDPRLARWLDRAAGTVFVALGIRLIAQR